MKIYIFVIKFLFISALFIASNNNLYLSHSDDMHTFLNLYFDWFQGILKNVSYIAGYVVKSEWLPVQG